MIVSTDASDVIENCATPHGDPAAAARAVDRLLEGRRPDPSAAANLVRLARIYGTEPFTPLSEAARLLGADRERLTGLVALFREIPQLRQAAQNGPAGKYWHNTVLPLERSGRLDAVVTATPAFPSSVGFYPGPTCMFRCHFCVRVTGARYDPADLASGNEMFASVIDELPTDNPHLSYLSGGLEPLTNPGLGDLVARAAARGFALTAYTNAFALTDQTLARQPGLWDLHAVRTSLYGLNDAEYEATTGKKNAFGRVRDNLKRFQRLRAEREAPVRLGLSYLVLPGRSGRLVELAELITELNEAAPERPLDFLNVREDYSGRPDGTLPPDERAELQDALLAFDERIAQVAPTLDVDYGYALESVRMGVDAQLLRIVPETMRPGAHPQVSVQIDLRGDVYLYREAGFPDLPGATRYIAGTVGPRTSLHDVVERFVTSGSVVAPVAGDENFMDGFDQAVTARLNQIETDLADGWGVARGFLR